MQSLIDLLHSCIVRITLPDESGTGFFVAPRHVLTCAHVISRVQKGTHVFVRWQGNEYSAQLEQVVPAPYPDLALLLVEEIEETHPCVLLDEEVQTQDVLYSYGFPDGYPEGSPSDFVCEGLTGGQAPLLTFKGGEVSPGFSGSPLLNLRTGGVCGMIRLTRGGGTLLGGRAIPVSTIFQHFPECAEAQRQFHTREQRWSQTRMEYVQRIKSPSPQGEKIWNVPYPRKQFFTGREALLKRLHTHLQTAQTSVLGQVISGLGGIGKTQLAVEYAYRHRKEYQAVLWARAETTEALTTSYTEMARLLQLPQKDAKEQEETIQGVKEWLSYQQHWLLILDNADEPDVLIPFLPPKVGGHLIVTTRAAELSHLGLGFGHVLTVPKFTKKQDVPFLLRQADLKQVSVQDRVYARRIADELDGLPLALNQVGVYLARTSSRLETYWNLYQQQRVTLMNA
ncbi:MAG: trypsin-like peptidase domain-containing protein [Minisyncoccia bacterium]